MDASRTQFITIKKLGLSHAKELSELLTTASPDYSRYFTPFDFSLSSIQRIFEKVENDHFYGIMANDRLMGFFMLRGLDHGFTIPTFGVWIAEQYQSLGLSKLAIHYCCSVCRVNKISKLMLKVYPDNLNARQLYEKMGFVFQYIDEKNENLVYLKEL